MLHLVIFLYATLNGLQAQELNTDGNCGVMPMVTWAKEASHRVDPLPKPVNLVIIQHTAGEECNTDEKCEEILRMYRNYHTTQLGWTDIAHSFYVGSSGKVYEGAGWSLVGAHTRGFNDRSIAISVMGDYRGSMPTVAAQKSVQDLVKCGVKKGYLTQDYKLVGHRQLSATESPGATFYGAIQQWPHWTNDTADLYEAQRRTDFHWTISQDDAISVSRYLILYITCIHFTINLSFDMSLG